ncbi:MAG: hypothetical protein M0Q43_00740 [Methanothrix sp.]|nr:hypothetical protein [Methanothrix sp.]
MGEEDMWMRHVDFENIKDMLHLVSINDGLLKPRDFDRLGVNKEILIKKSTCKPLARSTRYNYRKVMEHLGLIEINDGKYRIYRGKKVEKLLDATEFRQPMSEEGKEIIRGIIVENDDCRKHFFDIFMNNTTYDLHDLRENGTPIFVETPAIRKLYFNFDLVKDNEQNKHATIINAIKMRNSNGRIMELLSADDIYAVYWGIRRWSTKLNITNEIMIDFAEGRLIYPINPNFNKMKIYAIISRYICSADGDNEWIIIHVPYFIKSIITETRFSLDSIKKFLLNLKSENPSLIMFIPTSTIFIDIKTPYNRQDQLFRSSYLYDERNRYISHIRINRKLSEMLCNELPSS